jgi:hypothetical protein
MGEELGWSRNMLTGIHSLSLLIAAAAAIPVGRRIDRSGGRSIMTIGRAPHPATPGLQQATRYGSAGAETPVGASLLLSETGSYDVVHSGLRLLTAVSGFTLVASVSSVRTLLSLPHPPVT